MSLVMAAATQPSLFSLFYTSAQLCSCPHVLSVLSHCLLESLRRWLLRVVPCLSCINHFYLSGLLPVPFSTHYLGHSRKCQNLNVTSRFVLSSREAGRHFGLSYFCPSHSNSQQLWSSCRENSCSNWPNGTGSSNPSIKHVIVKGILELIESHVSHKSVRH